MLFSVIQGRQKNVNNEWELVEDNYNNTLITNQSIRQSIRLGKNVSKDLTAVSRVTEDMNEDIATSSKGYKIPENTFISNNYSNMNLLLMNYWTDDAEKMKLHADDHILFLTIMNDDYKLLGYDNCENEIVQTYKKNDVYQGCAITFKIIDSEKDVFKLYVKDLRKNRYLEISVYVAEPGVACTSYEVIDDRRTLTRLENTYNNLTSKRRSIQFKISTESGKLLTKAYITDKDSKQIALELTKDVKGAEIVVLEGDGEKLTDNDIRNINNIIHANTRAITLIGADVPRDFCRNFRILYLFKYFDDEGVLKCLKSN